MKKLFSAVLISALSSFLFAEISICELQGKVSFSDNSISKKKTAAVVNQKLLPENIIITAKNSYAVVLLENGTKRRIGPGSEVAVKSLLPAASEISLFKYLKKMSRSGSASPANASVAGVRGAEMGTKAAFGVNWGTASAKNTAAVDGLAEGDKLFAEAKYDASLEMYNNALSENPDDSRKVSILGHKAAALEELSRFSEAAACIASALPAAKKTEEREDLLYRKALYENLAGNSETSLSDAQTYMKEMPASGRIWAVKSLAFINLFNLGRKSEAVNLKEDILKNCSDAEILETVKGIVL